MFIERLVNGEVPWWLKPVAPMDPIYSLFEMKWPNHNGN
jgi:hypothetical protein